MDVANLFLIRQKITINGKSQFVQFRCIKATTPLEYLIIDIEYINIDLQKEYACLLTIMDVCTRSTLGHTLKCGIKKSEIILFIDGILGGMQTKGIIIRNGNDSHLLAHEIRNYLSDKGIAQDFVHVATPEENSYIEAWYKSLE